MTKAVFYRCNGFYKSIEINGHSGYSHEGNDIVCAAISSMFNFSSAILEKFNIAFTAGSGEEAEVFLEITKPAELSENILSALYGELESLTDEYPEFVSVTVKNI